MLEHSQPDQSTDSTTITKQPRKKARQVRKAGASLMHRTARAAKHPAKASRKKVTLKA